MKLLRRKCKICGKWFKTSLPQIALCLKCWDKQPKCSSCKNVMAPEYGSLDKFARNIGKYKICDGCNAAMKRKGCLHISASQYLLPSGRVTTKIPEEMRTNYSVENCIQTSRLPPRWAS